MTLSLEQPNNITVEKIQAKNSKLMRILLYSYNYYPEPIGIAPLMTELAEGLAEKGHEVRVLTAMPWYPESQIHPHYQGKLYCTEERNGVQIYRSFVWVSPKRSLINRALFELSFAVLSFWQGIKPWKPDLIFLTVPGLPVCLPASLLSKIYGCPVILNLQDILPDAAVHVGLLTNKRVIKVFKWLEKFAYKNADRISVIADGFTRNLERKQVDRNKIVEISNWVDIDFIKPIPKEESYFVSQNNLQGKFVVLYAGNIALTQPLETLIDAAAQLPELKNLVVVIVGRKKALARLQKYAQDVNCHNILFKPFQPREKLPEMLAAADIGMVMQKSNVIDFNLPSKIPVLLASGRTIIASVPNTGTAARAISQSGGGFVIPPEDASALATQIKQCYYDRPLLEIMSKKGREYAEQHYCFKIALDKYESLFLNSI